MPSNKRQVNSALGRLGDIGEALREQSENIDETSEDSQKIRRELDKTKRELNEKVDEITQLREQLDGAMNGSLVPTNGKWQLGRFSLTKTSIIAPDDLEQDEANVLGYALAGLQSAVQFWIGDWANWYLPETDNDNERGEAYKQLSEQFNIPVNTIKNYASVCRKVTVSRRRDTVSYSLHAEIAGHDDYDELMQWIEENNPSVRLLRDHIKSLSDTNQTSIVSDFALFSTRHKPNLSKLQSAYTDAQTGNRKSVKKVKSLLQEIRDWVQRIETEIDQIADGNGK